MKTAKSSKRTIGRPLLGQIIEDLKADIEAAGEKLGFDVSQEDWIEQAIEEADSYPLAIGGDEDAESLSKLMPGHIRARIQALQRIESLTTDLLPHIEARGNPAGVRSSGDRPTRRNDARSRADTGRRLCKAARRGGP
jgi:hypothetical protein